MHWITAPGTSQREERRISTAGQPRSCGEIPGVRNFGSHIGQAFLIEEVAGVNFGENWISVDPRRRYDETVAAVEEVVDGYPGLFRNVETYLNERIDEVLAGSSDADRRAHLRRRPRDPAQQGRGGGGHARGHRRRRRAARRAAGRHPADRGRGRAWPRPIATGSSPATSAGPRPRCSRARRSATSSGTGKAYDVHVWSTPASRDSLDRHPRAADRHARRAARPARRRRRRAAQARCRT